MVIKKVEKLNGWRRSSTSTRVWSYSKEMIDNERCPKCGKEGCTCDPETCDCEPVDKSSYSHIHQKELVHDFEE